MSALICRPTITFGWRISNAIPAGNAASRRAGQSAADPMARAARDQEDAGIGNAMVSSEMAGFDMAGFLAGYVLRGANEFFRRLLLAEGRRRGKGKRLEIL